MEAQVERTDIYFLDTYIALPDSFDRPHLLSSLSASSPFFLWAAQTAQRNHPNPSHQPTPITTTPQQQHQNNPRLPKFALPCCWLSPDPDPDSFSFSFSSPSSPTPTHPSRSRQRQLLLLNPPFPSLPSLFTFPSPRAPTSRQPSSSTDNQSPPPPPPPITTATSHHHARLLDTCRV